MIKEIYTMNGIEYFHFTADKVKDKKRIIKFGYIGRIENNQKGLVDFIKILIDKIGFQTNLFRIEIYGPESEDKRKISKLIKHVNYIKLKKPIDNDREKIAIIDSFDFAFLCSYFEGEPLFALEAQARGIPVISTKASNVNYHKNNPYCLSVNSIENLPYLILDLIKKDNYELLSSLSKEAIINRTWDSIVSKLKLDLIC